MGINSETLLHPPGIGGDDKLIRMQITLRWFVCVCCLCVFITERESPLSGQKLRRHRYNRRPAFKEFKALRADYSLFRVFLPPLSCSRILPLSSSCNPPNSFSCIPLMPRSCFPSSSCTRVSHFSVSLSLFFLYFFFYLYLFFLFCTPSISCIHPLLFSCCLPFLSSSRTSSFFSSPLLSSVLWPCGDGTTHRELHYVRLCCNINGLLMHYGMMSARLRRRRGRRRGEPPDAPPLSTAGPTHLNY